MAIVYAYLYELLGRIKFPGSFMEQKNVILAIALSFAILLGWNYWEQTQLEERAAAEQALYDQQVANGTLPAPSTTAAGAGAVSSGGVVSGAVTPNGLSASNVIVRPRNEILKDSARVHIDSDKLRGSIRLVGAKIDDLTLTNYNETLEEDSPEVVLLQPVGSKTPYFASFGWWANEGIETPKADTVWTASSTSLTPHNPVTLSWTNSQGVVFTQKYSLDENYMFNVEQAVTNSTGAAISVAPYGLISRSGTPDVLGYYILHEGLIGVINETLTEIDYDDLQETKNQEYESTGGWMGITDKYWLMALVPNQSEVVKARYHAITDGEDYKYQADFLGATQTLNVGDKLKSSAMLFAGAKQTTLLDTYEEELGIKNFDLAVDFGWFYFLTKPIFYAIHWLNGVLGNFGLAILALTLGIKAILYPLANKSYVSMSKMKLLQPKMKDMKDKYADDRQKLNQAMMELYKKEKVNPLSGCLPIIVQIPIFFSLYKVLFVTIEMRHAPFFGWIHDLSAQDPLGLLTAFGLFDWNVPQAVMILNVGLWPLIMGFTMWLQQRLNPTPTDPIQAKVFMFMPILFTFMLGTFPAGLVIYWAWNNTLSMAQQWMIMRRMGVAVAGGKIEDAK